MRYSIKIKNNINEVRIYTTVARDAEEALEKGTNTYRFTTDNLPIVEATVKEI